MSFLRSLRVENLNNVTNGLGMSTSVQMMTGLSPDEEEELKDLMPERAFIVGASGDKMEQIQVAVRLLFSSNKSTA